MNAAIELSNSSTTLHGNLLDESPSSSLPKSSLFKTASKILAIASVALAMLTDTKAQAATIYTPDWANKDTLNGIGSIQSTSTTGSSNRAGYIETVTTDLTTAESIQITWGVQARDIGFGLNVNNWNPYLEVRSLDYGSNTSSVVATIPLDLNSFTNLDGSPIQTITTGSATTFYSPVDYGVSSNGRTNYVFAYSLTGESLTALQDSLLIGENMFFSLVTSSNVTDGGAYILGGTNIYGAGGNSIAVLNGRDTNALPGGFSNSGVAFDLHVPVVPEPTTALLLTVAAGSLALRRRRTDSQE